MAEAALLPDQERDDAQQRGEQPRGDGAEVLGPFADSHADDVGAQRDPDRGQRRENEISAAIREVLV